MVSTNQGQLKVNWDWELIVDAVKGLASCVTTYK